MRIRAAAEVQLRAFLAELRAKRRSRSLVWRAASVLPRFFAHLAHERIYDLRRVEERHVVSFVLRLRQREGLSAATQAMYLGTVRAFLGFLVARRALLRNPAQDLALPHVERLPRAVLSVAQARRLMAAPLPWTACGRRDRALLETLYGCGLRIGECLSLDLRDIELSERVVFVHTGKGKVDRRVPLPGRAAAALQIYLEHARIAFVRDPRQEAVFLSFAGVRLSQVTVGQALSRYARQAKIPEGCRAHALRHAYATHLLKGGADVREVQLLLGHKRLQTTALYTRVLADDLQRMVDRAHPRARRSRR